MSLINQEKWKVVGLMSGTSLDGLDIAFCEFEKINKHWNYKIIEAETIIYTNELKSKLSLCSNFNAQEFWKFTVEFGRLMGGWTKSFLLKHNLNADLVASHGHTIFHQPADRFTCQIGHGAEIAIRSGIKTVCDFRSLDIALGGQGAPLVPIGDKILFHDYEACLNLGGIANITINNNESLIAFDICAVNQVLNHISKWKNLEFDKDGILGKQGKFIQSLFDKLNDISYFKMKGPKSLGREWVEKEIFPLLNFDDHATEDIAHTFYKHIQFQIETIFQQYTINSCLVSGGGAHNQFLIELLRQNSKTRIHLPKEKIIDFKEALIFAFLGLLRTREEINTQNSVTGASKNSCGGCIYLS